MERFYHEEKRALQFEEWLRKIKLSDNRIESIVIILSNIDSDFSNQLCGLDSLYRANTEQVVNSIFENLLSDPTFIDLNEEENDEYFNAVQLYYDFIISRMDSYKKRRNNSQNDNNC